MEITRKNFQESLEVIESAVKEASFIAIDGEFTGLNHAGLTHTAVFDTPEERYHKLVQGSGDFMLIQFGLCAFIYDGSTKKYTAKPFNFYIFPRPFSRAAPDVRFSCQSSSLDFLMSQGFDFNKWIRDGIPYLRPVDEARLKEQVIKKHEVFASPAFISPSGGSQPGGVTKGPVDIPPEQKDFVDDICKKVEKFLESGEHESLSLPPCTGFQRKLTYQSLQTKYGGELHLQSKTGENKERFIVVTKVKGEDQMKKMEESRQAQDMAEIDAAVGFTHVIKMISQSGKLIVGHNMMLDIAHTINQFMYPLPQAYEDFKSMCRCVFPRLVDTKLMSNTQPFKDRIDNTGLSYLHHLTQMPPFVKPEVEISEDLDNKYKDNEALHEAGYDAFVTGQCFISLSNFLGQFQQPPSDHVPPASPLLEPFLNKIFMMRSLDIPYMDLVAADLSPSRDHVFHLTFPKDWKSSDISLLFAQFGNVYIGWIDEVSAYVSLHSKSVASSVLKTLCKKGSVYRLMSYNDHKNHTLQEHKNQYKWTNQKPEHQSHGHNRTHSHSHSHHTTVPSSGPNLDGEESGGARKGTKRPHSPENGVPVVDTDSGKKKAKSLNVDAPEFQSRITPTSTPEKDDNLQWPENINSSGKKIDKKEEDKFFPEPDDW
ncbi:poly(A)-specific ribonuclease PARN-like isoform X3 [Mercenaria mercenaria]|uniref:poly(A)-specific ribonuclease PARN-like isoform X3 n=1 Tax=Mercenaria mercenaria TaxID=6596 RepID=UPI00234EBA02|nr:poly(A)-specific ribonuclease PARN-like isoform X3 [Mercenaria mercenaria]